jgi:hypothetical protein
MSGVWTVCLPAFSTLGNKRGFEARAADGLVVSAGQSLLEIGDQIIGMFEADR